jgi:protein transport protein SEC31
LLLLGRYDIAVELCVQEDRFTEAILIANFFDKNLLQKTQQRYFRKHKNKFSNVNILRKNVFSMIWFLDEAS